MTTLDFRIRVDDLDADQAERWPAQDLRVEFLNPLVFQLLVNSLVQVMSTAPVGTVKITPWKTLKGENRPQTEQLDLCELPQVWCQETPIRVNKCDAEEIGGEAPCEFVRDGKCSGARFEVLGYYLCAYHLIVLRHVIERALSEGVG